MMCRCAFAKHHFQFTKQIGHKRCWQRGMHWVIHCSGDDEVNLIIVITIPASHRKWDWTKWRWNAGASEHIDNSDATCVDRGKDGMAIRKPYKLHVYNAWGIWRWNLMVGLTGSINCHVWRTWPLYYYLNEHNFEGWEVGRPSIRWV